MTRCPLIDEHIDSESKTLETGAGVSTVLFALKGTQHTCIVPDQAQVQPSDQRVLQPEPNLH